MLIAVNFHSICLGRVTTTLGCVCAEFTLILEDNCAFSWKNVRPARGSECTGHIHNINRGSEARRRRKLRPWALVHQGSTQISQINGNGINYYNNSLLKCYNYFICFVFLFNNFCLFLMVYVFVL